MRIAKAICVVMILLALIHFGIAFVTVGVDQGVGMDVFQAGYLANPWQAVINFDLMAGLTLMTCWVFWRERNRADALVWIAVLLYWGNLVVAIYLYRQLDRSGGSWERVFLGQHATSAAPSASVGCSLPLRIALLLAAAAMAVFVAQGCWSVGWALIPLVGYLWGFGSLAVAFLMLARAPSGTTP